MLKAGLPVKKIDCFRSLFEEHTFSLTSSTNLRQIIPLVHKIEMDKIKKAIDKKHISIIFDGTTNVCEAMVIVVRYITDDYYGPINRIRDSSQCMIVHQSMRYIAMRTVKTIYNHVVDIGCFSHTLDHIGEHMHMTILHKFLKAWVNLFSRSLKTCLF